MGTFGPDILCFIERLSSHIVSFIPPLPSLYRQCHRCCIESGDDLAPTIASFDEPASRCGRKINAPKVFTFPEDQVPNCLMYCPYQ